VDKKSLAEKFFAVLFFSKQKKMEKQATSRSSPTTSGSSTYSIHDPPGYIKPSLQEMLFTDITAEELLTIAKRLGVDYLGPAPKFPASFPVEGEIYGPNKRLMVNLACRRRRTNTSAINIIFFSSISFFLSILALQLRTYRPRPWKH
jgi:hypothetical protein